MSREHLLLIGFAILVIVCFNFYLSRIIVYNPNEALLPIPKTLPTTLSSTTTTTLSSTIQYPYPYPVFVVGLPKVGTTSIHEMFACNGIKSSHYCCCGSNRTHTHCNDGSTFAECMRKNNKNKRPILEGCGDYNVYAQMDAEFGKSMFLPQRFHLEQLHKYAPNATLILNIRPDKDWLHSVTNWFGLGGRFLRLFKVDIDKTERNQALLGIFNNHSNYIREFVRLHPSHKLLEVDISESDAGKKLANAFSLKAACWGKHNVHKKAAKL